ncbi:MAG: hypothetical protein ACLFRF_09985 [Desulfobacterales bacterium]
MLTHYLILDLPLTADDETIRQRYLEKVKQYSPESDPIIFRRISAAYDAIKNERCRIQSTLFETLHQPDWGNQLYELAAARQPKRKRVGLKDLINAAGGAPKA